MAALSEQLTAVHQALRERLVLLREEALDGARSSDDVLADDLRSHCLGLCSAVRTHHSGEDNQL